MNESGIYPVEFRVLIKPKPIEETDEVLKKAKEAGIYTGEQGQREQMAQMEGELIAHGGNAFGDWQKPIPEVGCTVIFAKYAGYQSTGNDGEVYRVLNDKDISAIKE